MMSDRHDMAASTILVTTVGVLLAVVLPAVLLFWVVSLVSTV